MGKTVRVSTDNLPYCIKALRADLPDDPDEAKDRDEAEPVLDNFGTRLWEFRKALKLTAPEFAKALGLNGPELLSQWENNDSLPTTNTLINMARQFGIDLNSLCVGTPSAAIVVELNALRAIKAEFRQYRGVIDGQIKQLKQIDRITKELLRKLGLAETEATKKRKSLEKAIL